MGQLDYTIRPIEEINDRQGRADFFGELATLQNLREYHKGKYTLIRCSGSRYEWSARSRNVLKEALREAERIHSESDPFIAIEIKGEIVYHFDLQKIKDTLLAYVQRQQIELAYAKETSNKFLAKEDEDHAEVWQWNAEQINNKLNKIKSYDLWKN